MNRDNARGRADLDGSVQVQVGDVLSCDAGKVTISYPVTNQVILLKDFL